jgi:hypothetical protein
MECKACDFKCEKQSIYNRHFNSEKHKFVYEIFNLKNQMYEKDKESQKRLEEANLENEQKLKEANLIFEQEFRLYADKSSLNTIQREQEFQNATEREREYAIQREQEFKQEIATSYSNSKQILKQEIDRAYLAKNQREQEYHSHLDYLSKEKEKEKERSEQKLKECRLEGLHKYDEMQLHNMSLYTHMRDHGIDLTTGNYSTKLSKIKPAYQTSKSMCESLFHHSLMNTLLEPLGMNSLHECTVCTDFRELSNKIFSQTRTDMLKSDLAINLTVSKKIKM